MNTLSLWSYIASISGLVFLMLLGCTEAEKFQPAAQFSDSLLTQVNDRGGDTATVFKSVDDGQTWEDISKGLPENLPADSFRGNRFFANDNGLFLRVGNALYRSTTNTDNLFWTKQTLQDGDSSLEKSGISPDKYWGANLKTRNGTSVWSPIFEIYHRPGTRSVFETGSGSIFIGTDRGFFKTADKGATWKQVHDGRLVGHLAGSDGVLMAISTRRLIRSADDGENWEVVTGEGVVAWDVKQINGGFAAVTSGSESGTRSLRTSYDAGKTWQPIDAALKDKIDSIWRTWDDRPSLQTFQTSIIKIGENFYCTHTGGIFKSSDRGRTWKLLLPSVKDKVFNLFVAGDVIYAVASKGGC